jgi:FtsH-binding integral membrane protein
MRRFADSMTWADDKGFAISAALDSRMAFVRRTYAHLLGELVAVALVTTIALRTPSLAKLAVTMLGNPLIYIASFFGVSLLTRAMLAGQKSMGIQYAAAAIWVFFLGLLVTPFAMWAKIQTGSYEVMGQGAILTACVFTGITAYVFFTKKDFSFLGGALWMISWIAFGLGIILSIFGGFGNSTALFYSCGMVLLLGGWVLYDTSRVLHHRHVNEHVAASVDLLVDFVYMFIYIVSILLRSRR